MLVLPRNRRYLEIMRFRSVLWLVALCAFVLPPSLASTAAMVSAAHPAMGDCPDHAPPPAPCPDKDSAKHAAGLCCPFMALTVAVLPVVAASADGRGFSVNVAPASRDLTGLSLTKDPPPPRV
jgi:hypothetical protein